MKKEAPATLTIYGGLKVDAYTCSLSEPSARMVKEYEVNTVKDITAFIARVALLNI